MEALITLLQKATDFLQARGVEHPRVNAEHLFAHGLGCRRLDLYLRFEQPVTATEQDTLRGLVLRRSKREPLQYIIGDTEFYGMKLRCDPRALIPRHETEELVEQIVEHYRDREPPARVLDLGTGSGCLALALARAFPQAEITATDSSPEALALAGENAQTLGLTAPRLTLCQSNWLTSLDGASFDLIVSNPPYLTPEEWENAAPEVRLHEPQSALVGGGKDGADDLRMIIMQAGERLNDGGLLALETGIAQHPELIRSAGGHGFHQIISRQDLQKHPRFLFATRAF